MIAARITRNAAKARRRPRVEGGGEAGGRVGRRHSRKGQGAGDAQIDPDPPPVSPEAEQHIRHDHDQGCSLGGLLVEVVQ
jgi:hypothetical protein